MKLSFRWYGDSDPISLEYISQIPGMRSIVTAVYDVKPGEVWPEESLARLKAQCEEHGLVFDVVESIPVSEDIKLGTDKRDAHIEAYCENVRRCAKYGVKCVTYNFMPVFDWTRTQLAKPRKDGSTVLAYDQREIDKMDPEKLFASMEAGSQGHLLPGWEPERLAHIQELFQVYKSVDEEALWANLKYFLDAILPICEKYEVKMAIHPDDPGWSVFGLPRIITSGEALRRMVDMSPSPCNGVTLCTGSLGTNPHADLPGIIHMLEGSIFFAHVRNMEHTAPGQFEESAHLSSDGSFDMFAIVKALYETGFDGVIRPDHGRMIWGEQAMPGYGLYDRALGSQYLLGLWEALEKTINR